MAKTGIAGTWMLNIIAKSRKSEKEIKKAAAVLLIPLTVPLKNKIMGRIRRKNEPITGIKNAAKIEKAITNNSFRKGLLRKGMLNFFKDDNLLKT
jgi:hypothetical protein